MKQTTPTQNHIKLVVSDVDGTLVKEGPKSVPTKKVIQALASLKEKGVRICLATGRNLSEMQPILSSFPFDGPVVLCGGSCVYDLNDNKVVWEKNLSLDLLEIILTHAKRYQFRVKIFDLHRPYIVNSTNLQDQIPNHTQLKIRSIVLEKPTTQGFKELLAILKKLPNIHATYAGKWENTEGIQITNIQATKQYAIYEVFKILKIDRTYALGIGDKPNDIPLLSACHTKIAMGNAHPDIKSIADYTTSTVDNDGFADAMEKYVLI